MASYYKVLTLWNIEAMLKFLFDDNKSTQILRSLDLTQQPPPLFSVGIAHDTSDYIDAAQLLQESFQRRAIPIDEKAKVRAIPHLIPQTSTLIVAKSGSRVVGTALVVRSNPLGFPVEGIVDLDAFEQYQNDAQGLIGEISCLAVAQDYVGKPASVFFPLAAYLFRYCQEFLKLETVLIATQPSLSEFYRAVFGFDFLFTETPEKFRLAGGTDAVALHAKVDAFPEWVKSKLSKAPHGEELQKLFLEMPYSNPAFHFPPVDPSGKYEQTKSSATLEELYLNQSSVMAHLGVKQRTALAALYPQTDVYKWIFKTDPNLSKRKARRYDVTLRTTLFDEAGNTRQGTILDVSEQGLRLSLDEGTGPEIILGNEISFILSLSASVDVALKAKVKWIKAEEKQFGLELTIRERVYLDYIQSLKTAAS